MSFWDRAAGYLNNTRFGTPVHFLQDCTGIGADIVTDDILYAIFDIRLDDICYSSRTDRIAVCKLSMGEPCSLFFVQLKQDLAAL